MARFESERDPEDIQEKLSLSVPESSNGDGSSLPFGEDYEQRDTSRGEKSGRDSQRYKPYSKSPPPPPPPPPPPNKSTVIEEEKVMKSAPGHKVFVANLAFSTTEKILEDYMARGES